MLSAELKQAANVWPALANIVSVPRTEEEYERTVALLDELIDEVGENEKHPLASLMDTLGTLIEAYEDRHFPKPVGDPISTPAKTLCSSDNHKQDGPTSTNLQRRAGEGRRRFSPSRP